MINRKLSCQLNLLHSFPTDWLYGVLNGKTGFFPSQLVEPLAGQSSQIHPPVSIYSRDDQLNLT